MYAQLYRRQGSRGYRLRHDGNCGGIGMSLKIELKNLGVLKHAEFSLGDLTLICGKNNTGKTYIAYALYGFLKSWRNHIRFPVSDSQIQRLLTEGGIKIDLGEHVEKADRVLKTACKRYTNQLDTVFAASEGRFRNSEFHIRTEPPDVLRKKHEGKAEIEKTPIFTYLKKMRSGELIVTLAAERERQINSLFAKETISSIIGNTVFFDSFPAPFISSTERTGAAIFRGELDFAARNRPSERMGRTGQRYPRYPLPVDANVDFVRELEYVARRQSFIAKEHPEVLTDFADIIGGKYTITQGGRLYYTPKGTQDRLTMVESSSAVRSLVDIGFYLSHVARKDGLLMVDEPELNLHPENQRRIARLFARLVNLGVKVFITTHSDYIVKELNTLIMLDHNKTHIKKIAIEHGYDRKAESINVNKVKVYTAKETLIPLQAGQKRRRRGHTLVEADIHPELGIEAPSFDDTINKMNRIQRDIVWGAE